MRTALPRYLVEISEELATADINDLVRIARREHQLVCMLAGEISALKMQLDLLLKDESRWPKRIL